MAFKLSFGKKKDSSSTSFRQDKQTDSLSAKTSLSDLLAATQEFGQSRSATTSASDETAVSNVMGRSSQEELTVGGNIFTDAFSYKSGQQATQQYGDQLSVGGGNITRVDVSPEAIGNLVDSILGKYQGLSQVSMGQKTAGLYDSTTTQSQTNDLISKVVGEVARLSSPVVTENLAQLVTRGPDVQTIGESLETSGGSQITTPKLVASTGTQDQLQVSATKANQQQVQESDTFSTATQQQQVKEAETEELSVDEIMSGTSKTKGKSKGGGINLGFG